MKRNNTDSLDNTLFSRHKIQQFQSAKGEESRLKKVENAQGDIQQGELKNKFKKKKQQICLL